MQYPVDSYEIKDNKTHGWEWSRNNHPELKIDINVYDQYLHGIKLLQKCWTSIY